MEEKEREENFRLRRFKQLKGKHKRAAAIKLCHCCLKVFQELYEKPLSLCAACAGALTKDIKQKQGKDVVVCRNDGPKLLEFLDIHTKEVLKLIKDLRSHGLPSASMEQLIAPSGQINLNIIVPEQIFKQIPVSSFADKSRSYTCGADKPFVDTCCVYKLIKYIEASLHPKLPSEQRLKMYSPAGSQEEELIIYDDDIINIGNISIVTSIETQSVVVESEEQDLELSAISFVDTQLETDITPSSVNLVASVNRNRTSKILKTSSLLKQTSEQYNLSQRLPYDDVIPLKPEVPYRMPQNLDAHENPVSEFIESFSPYTTEFNAIRPEISSVLRTPCIYHVDTGTSSSESSSTTKKTGSIKPVTQKYQRSVKIRTYHNPDGSVTEEKKIVEQTSTLNRGNININDLYTSDEDETKIDDMYFESLFKDVPNELDEDDLNFLDNNVIKINVPAVSRKTKSEKIHTGKPMADLQLKTSISGKVVSSLAENASNEDNSRVSYVNSDIKRNPFKNPTKIMDRFSEKSSNGASFSRKTKSKNINTNAPMTDPYLKTSISGKVVSSKVENASYEDNSIVSYVHSDIKRNRLAKERPKESEKEIQSMITDQISTKSSDGASISRKSKSEKINTSASMTEPQLKTVISGKVQRLKAGNGRYKDNIVSNVHSDIKRDRPTKELETDKEILSEILNRVSTASSIDTNRSISANKKHNVVTRSTSTDAIMIKNEATNTDIKLEKSNIKETTHRIELKRQIREEFDNLLTKTGKKTSQKDFDKFSKKIYDKYRIQLMEMHHETDDRKSLELKHNKPKEIESNTIKGLEKEEQMLQAILNTIRSKTKDGVNEQKRTGEDSYSEIEPKPNEANLSVKGSLEQYSKNLLATVEYIKEGVKSMFSRENSRLSPEIEKGGKDVINKLDEITIRAKETVTNVDNKGSKIGDVKSQDINVLNSSQSDDSVLKASVETFNKRGLQIWDSEDDPKGVVQSAIKKFNEERRQPETMAENRAKKLEDTKTKYNAIQTKSKEETKPNNEGFLIKEIEIVDKQFSPRITPESNAHKEMRAFRSSSHPDKTTTDSDVTSKSEGIAKDQVVTAGNSKKEVTILNDMLEADKENVTDKIKLVQSELDKKSVILPTSEFSSESHLKTKIKRIKEKGRKDKFELHSVYKEVSTSSHGSEVSKLSSKQSSSIHKHDNIPVTKQDNVEVPTIDLKDDKIQYNECERKIIICKKCLMALCGFIPSKIVEETEVCADCQLCRLKEKEVLILPNSNSYATEEAPSFTCSPDEERQICVNPVLPYEKCFDKQTWSETYPCGRPKEDQKLVNFRDASYNKSEQDRVNDDVTKFVMTLSPCTSPPIISDNAMVSTVPTEPTVPTVSTVVTEQNFAEMLAKSLVRLLGIQKQKQTTEMVSSCESEETYDSCESETFKTPCSTKVCTREAATNTKTSSRYDVRCLRDLPPFKKEKSKSNSKSDTDSNNFVNSDITLEMSRMRDPYLSTVSSNSLDDAFIRNKNTCTKTEQSKYICKKKKRNE